MAFEDLKQRQSVAWGSAPYERVSVQHLHVIDDLLDRLSVQTGVRLLAVATGPGELARPAARRGATVSAIDYAPALVETARSVTEQEGLDVAYEVADAEALPYPDASFDVVTSTFGVMFAPDQERASAELARVTAPGGQIGLTVWKRGGGVNQMFAVQRAFMATPPAGAGNPFDWGDRERLAELLGSAFDLDITEDVVPQTGPNGESIWRLMSGSYGPTRALAASLDDERRAQFQSEFANFFDQHRTNGHVELQREFLRVIGRRR
jgi:SAM-dependent methyltransferase